ncbi:MAG: zinc ribbon domain-containing protein [Acidobacteriia bacterium]|nr:zinc ribbon domain-containing protein [Terriglobia bacterium]
MPIYEYRCEDCGTKFEKLVRRANGVTELACPSCGHQHLKQELSTFAAHANGSNSKSAEGPVCPSGQCSNPGMCGMNFN